MTSVPNELIERHVLLPVTTCCPADAAKKRVNQLEQQARRQQAELRARAAEAAAAQRQLKQMETQVQGTCIVAAALSSRVASVTARKLAYSRPMYRCSQLTA